MSKKRKLNLETEIISQIKTRKITMKPRWYFVAGSLLLFSGLVGLSMGIIFLVNLSAFLIRRNGPLMSWRLQSILSTFPWWIPIMAAVGIILAVWLLKKYDFSYKKNFPLIIVAFILSILLAGLLIDSLGLNEQISKGRMRGFYKRFELQDNVRGSVRGIRKNNQQWNIK